MVWLYDIDCYWTERMPTMHPTQPEVVPLYYTSLCGFVGLAVHLIAAHSLDINSKGSSHTTPFHAASKVIQKLHRFSLEMVPIPTLVTISAEFHFIKYHRADNSSWRNHHSRSHISLLILARMWMSPTVKAVPATHGCIRGVL
jgi:hypothetical protein